MERRIFDLIKKDKWFNIDLLTCGFTQEIELEEIIRQLNTDANICTELGKKISDNLIKDVASHVFNVNEQFIVELIVNGFDAQLPDKSTGKFGVGFFSSLVPLLQYNDIEMNISTNHEGLKYTIGISYIDKQFNFKVNELASEMESKLDKNGTIIQYKLKDSTFSIEEISSLHEEIKRLLYYDLGALHLNYDEFSLDTGLVGFMKELNDEVKDYSGFFSNSSTTQLNDFKTIDPVYPRVNVKIGDKEITIEDKGSGIPFSVVLTKLLVPSSSTKEIKVESIVFNSDNRTRIMDSPDQQGRLYILVNKVGVVKMEYLTKKKPKIFIIDLPYTFNLPVARNDVILTKDDNSLNVFFMHLDIIIEQLIRDEQDISIIEEAINEYKKLGTQTSALYYINEHLINKFNEIFADDTPHIPIPVNKPFIKNIISNGITVDNFQFTKLTKELRTNKLIDKIILFKKIMHVPGLEKAESFREFIFSGILPDKSNITEFFNHLNRSPNVIYESAINLDTDTIEAGLDIKSVDELYYPEGFGTSAGYRSFLYLYFLYNYPKLNLATPKLLKIKGICERINRILYERRINQIFIKSLTEFFNFIFHKVLFGNENDEIMVEKLMDSFEDSSNRDYVLSNTNVEYGYASQRIISGITRPKFFVNKPLEYTLKDTDILVPYIVVNKFLFFTKSHYPNEVMKYSLSSVGLHGDSKIPMRQEQLQNFMRKVSGPTFMLNTREIKTFDYTDFVRSYPLTDAKFQLDKFKDKYIDMYNKVKSTNSIQMIHSLKQRIEKLKGIYSKYNLSESLNTDDAFAKLSSFIKAFLDETSANLVNNQVAMKEMVRPIVLAWKQSYEMVHYGRQMRTRILKAVRNNLGKRDSLSYLLGSRLYEIFSELMSHGEYDRYKLVSINTPSSIVIEELFEEYNLVKIVEYEETDPLAESRAIRREDRRRDKKRTLDRKAERRRKYEQEGGDKTEQIEKVKIVHVDSIITIIMKYMNSSKTVYDKSKLEELVSRMKEIHDSRDEGDETFMIIPTMIFMIIHKFIFLYDLNIFMDYLTESINYFIEMMNTDSRKFKLEDNLHKDPTEFNRLVFRNDEIIERINLANLVLELYITAETEKKVTTDGIDKTLVDYNTIINESIMSGYNLIPSKLFNFASYPLINELENKMMENLKFIPTKKKGEMMLMQLYLLPRFFLNYLPNISPIILNGISKIISAIKEENLEAWEYYVVGFIYACCFSFENNNMFVKKHGIYYPQYEEDEFSTIYSDTNIQKIVKFLPGIELSDIKGFLYELVLGTEDRYHFTNFLVKNGGIENPNQIVDIPVFNKFNMFFALLLDSTMSFPDYTDFETKKNELIGPVTEISSNDTKLSQFIRQLYSEDEGKLQNILKNIGSDSPEIGLQLIKIAVNSGSPKQVEVSVAIELLQNSIDASASKVPFRNWYSNVNPYDIENINLFEKTCNRGVDLIITKTGSDPDNQIVFVNRDYIGFSNLQQIIPLSVPYYSNKVSGTGQMGNGFFNAYRRTDKVYIYSKSMGVNFLIEDTPIKTKNIVTDIQKNIKLYEQDFRKQNGTSVIIKFAKQPFEEMSHSLTNLVIEMQKLLNNVPYFNSKLNNIEINPEFKLFYSSHSLKIFVSKNMSNKAFVLTDGVPFSDFERFNKLNFIVPPNIEPFTNGIILDIQRNQLKPTQGRIDATFTPELLNELRGEILNVIALKYYFGIYHGKIPNKFKHEYDPNFLDQVVPDGRIYNLNEYNDYYSYATRYPMPSLVKEGRKNNFNRLLTFIIRFGLITNIEGFDRRINLCFMANDCSHILNNVRYARSFDISSPPNYFKHIIYYFNIVYDLLEKEENRLEEMFNKNNKKLINYITLTGMRYVKGFFDGFKQNILMEINKLIDHPITLDHDVFKGEPNLSYFPGYVIIGSDEMDDPDNLLNGNIPDDEQNEAPRTYNPPATLLTSSSTLTDPSTIDRYLTDNFIVNNGVMYILMRTFVDTYINTMIEAGVSGFTSIKSKPIVQLEFEQSSTLGYYMQSENLLSINSKPLQEHGKDFNDFIKGVIDHEMNFVSKVQSSTVFKKYFSPYNGSTVLHELEHYRREDGGHKRSNEACAVTGFHQSIISEFPNDEMPIERTFDNCFIDTFKIAIENDLIRKWITEIVRLKPLIMPKLSLPRPI